jgi:hypothetical protein
MAILSEGGSDSSDGSYGSGKAREISLKEISLGEDFGDVAVKVNGVRVEVYTDGSILAYTNGRVDAYTNGPVQVHLAANDDTAAKAAHEIGYKDRTGGHEGEIYGGVFPDGKPGWISEEPNPMSHYDAVKLKGRALPTSEEGKYIDTIKGKGDLKDIFARHSDGCSTAGYFWLAEHNYGYYARYQQFSDGHQNDFNFFRTDELPVLSVRR